MDAMHPRLLVSRFDACFRFYDAVLPPLTGARLARGTEAGPYASWDIGSEGAVTLLDRATMASIAGTAGLPSVVPHQDAGMLVSRVADVAEGYSLCLAHGAAPVAPPAARPEWGPTTRTAHVRDPEGYLWELQSY